MAGAGASQLPDSGEQGGVHDALGVQIGLL
jgi:hypothetical protein